MSYPKNADEWWQLAADHKEDIASIVSRYCSPEQAEIFITAVDSREGNASNIIGIAWCNAPDSPRIHDIPGWHELCDLLSESYLVDENLGGVPAGEERDEELQISEDTCCSRM